METNWPGTNADYHIHSRPRGISHGWTSGRHQLLLHLCSWDGRGGVGKLRQSTQMASVGVLAQLDRVFLYLQGQRQHIRLFYWILCSHVDGSLKSRGCVTCTKGLVVAGF